VLRLEGAASVEHQLDKVLREGAIAFDTDLAVERLCKHEVQVAVLRVAEDDRVVIAMEREQPGECLARVAECLYRHDDVLEKGGRAGGSGAGDGRVQPLAHSPQVCAHQGPS
jgi:hypothetical protein